MTISKKLLILIFISVSFSSCTIVGNYYLINSSDQKIKVSIKINPVNRAYLSMKQLIDIKSSKYKNRKVKFSTYKKMKTHFFTVDSLSNTINFELESKLIAHLGFNFNGREIGEIKIVDHDKTPPFEFSQGKFRSRGLMKYVMLYEYE